MTDTTPTDPAALSAEVERLKAENERLRAMLKGADAEVSSLVQHITGIRPPTIEGAEQ